MPFFSLWYGSTSELNSRTLIAHWTIHPPHNRAGQVDTELDESADVLDIHDAAVLATRSQDNFFEVLILVLDLALTKA